MKKFLSLVLALVMTMSLVTISAGAKDFTDGDDIEYTEAVDVISAIGVVDGYTDDSFKPGNTLTRGAAAKIICNLLLGPTTAAALSADAAPFSDVPTTNEFAGYIAYCSQQKIISGYADGTFRPAGTLTSYAFMKMLLGALGYDSELEGYVGANWSVQVAKTALGIGLDDGLVEDFNGLKAVTREEACLYAFNTLTANMVKYGQTTNIVIGDAQVDITGERGWDKDVDVKTEGNIKADNIVQFAERYFSKLELNDDDVDAFGRPSNTWVYKTDKIGTYAKTPDAKYVANTAEADIYSDIGMTTDYTFDVVIDGVKATTYKAAANMFYDVNGKVEINKGEEDDKVGLGNGAIIEVFKEDRIITIMNTYVGEVVAVEEATSKRDAYIELAQLDDKVGDVYTNATNTSGNAVLDSYTFTTEGFEVGDIVTFNYSLKGTDGEVKNVKAAEAVTGNVESFTTDKKFSMDGTTYEYGAKKVNVYGSADIGTQSTVYMDENGYVLYAKEGDDNLKNYALVLNAGTKSNLTGTSAYEAYLLYTDGTTAVVTTDKQYGTATATGDVFGSTGLIGSWVTYKTNSKGETVLTQPGTTDNHKISATSTALTVNGDTGIKLGSNNLKINSGTVIIVKDKNDNFKVCEGVKGVPTITLNGTDKTTPGAVDAYSAYGTGTFQKLVYIDLAATGVDINYGSNKTIFLVGDKTSKEVNTSSDRYYVFDAVVDGVIVEDGVMLDATDYDNAYSWGATGTSEVIATLLTGKSVALDSYAVDSGLYTVDMADRVQFGNGGYVDSGKIEKVSGDCIAFNSSAFYTADDCVFYRVDVKGNLKKSSINGVRTANVDSALGEYYAYVYYTTNSDAELTGVYWVEGK